MKIFEKYPLPWKLKPNSNLGTMEDKDGRTVSVYENDCEGWLVELLNQIPKELAEEFGQKEEITIKISDKSEAKEVLDTLVGKYSFNDKIDKFLKNLQEKLYE